MKLKIVIFLLIWGLLFYEILFEPVVYDTFFYFLKHQPLLAPFALIFMQVMLSSLMLPCSPLTVFAGILWGFKVGIVYSTLGTVLSSMWSFLLGRHLLRNWFYNKTSLNLILKMQRIIKNYSWKASAIAHMNPIFPGASIGYFFGTSNITLFSFSIGAIVGTFPLQLIMVGFGHLTYGALSQHLDIRLLFCLLFIVIIFIVYRKFVSHLFNLE